MPNFIGAQPGRVFSETEALQGKCPALGTKFAVTGGTNTGALTNLTTAGGDVREYMMVKVGAGLNLVNGNVVQVTGNFVATLAGSAGAGGVANFGPIAVIVASITASASQLVCAQIYGMCNVLVEATGSANTGAGVKLGGTSGQVTAVAVVTASNWINGMTIMATVSAIGLGAIFLNYPRVDLA